MNEKQICDKNEKAKAVVENKYKISLTKKQYDFICAGETEVLFGGAAGGGKSYAQVCDSLVYAVKYQGSKQLILRRTLVELEKSLLRCALQVYPKGIYVYRESKHTFEFTNGSIVDFGYIGLDSDVYKYQSAEYDVIRFDELTHFSSEMYLYMLSRLRGANDFPKSIKSTTNPGGVGHDFVRARFIDCGAWETPFEEGGIKRIFIPCKAHENKFLIEKDPEYIKRLECLPAREKQALLYGNWDIFEGRFFGEFDRDMHVCTPFEINRDMRIFCAFDYGLDMLACYFIALDSFGNCTVFAEIYQPDLIISQCVEKIKNTGAGYAIEAYIAPPDMWNRNRESGDSVADIFRRQGVNLQKANSRRDVGWMMLKELLKVGKNEFGEEKPRLQIFPCCTNLIRCLSSILVDSTKPFDCATNPHELTHSVDALRYFASFYRREPKKIAKTKREGERGLRIARV